MSDRVKGLIVTFEEDVSKEWADRLVDAIKIMKGVVSVKPSITNINDCMSRERVKWELLTKLQNILLDKDQ